VLVRTVAIHDEDLIALELVARGLKNDALAIGRPIRFGVLSAVRQLMDFAQMRGRLRQHRPAEEKV
jgi:hypothetical protein